MRWLLDSISWFLNYVMLRGLWLTLRALRVYNPELRQPFAATLSRSVYTVVFWPDMPASPSLLLDSRHMSTEKPSTSWSLLWMPSRMSDTPGKPGVEHGTPEMQSTSNFPAQHNGQ